MRILIFGADVPGIAYTACGVDPRSGSHLLGGDLSRSPKYLKSMLNILLAESRDQDACNQARTDSMREILAFLEGWK